MESTEPHLLRGIYHTCSRDGELSGHGSGGADRNCYVGARFHIVVVFGFAGVGQTKAGRIINFRQQAHLAIGGPVGIVGFVFTGEGVAFEREQTIVNAQASTHRLQSGQLLAVFLYLQLRYARDAFSLQPVIAAG